MDVTGRSFNDPGSIKELNALYLHSVVLVPGHSIPFCTTRPQEIKAFKEIAKSKQPIVILAGCFGYNPHSDLFTNTIATASDLQAIKQENNDQELNAILVGRQRVRLNHVIRQDYNLFTCRVEFLPELSIETKDCWPVRNNILPKSFQYYAFEPEISVKTRDTGFKNSEEDNSLKFIQQPSSSSQASIDFLIAPRKPNPFVAFDTRLSSWLPPLKVDKFDGKSIDPEVTEWSGKDENEVNPQRLQNLKPRLWCRRDAIAVATQYLLGQPFYVYTQLDINYLIAEIRMELHRWHSSWHIDHWNTELAVPFSYWLMHNLPISCRLKMDLLGCDNLIERFLLILSTLRNSSILICRVCRTPITAISDVICLALEGGMGTYVNPAGTMHEVITLSRATVRIVGRPSCDFSWFPGYAWTCCYCNNCHNFTGWRFTADKPGLVPKTFWGLRRDALSSGRLFDDTAESSNINDDQISQIDGELNSAMILQEPMDDF